MIFLIIVGFCSLAFILLGLYFKTIDRPAWFFSGERLDKGQITDIRSYNKKLGDSYIIYGLSFLIAAIIGKILRIDLSLLVVTIMIVGIFLLYLRYKNLREKFTRD